MKILIVDDEKIAIASLRNEIAKAVGGNTRFYEAGNGVKALQVARKETPDIVFLDIEMPGMSGIELAKRLKEICPQANLVIVTAYSQYALEAWRLHVSDYLLKPADEHDVRVALENLRLPLKREEQGNKLVVQCFGNFEIFYRGEVVSFTRNRAKEMFAYLVTRRGATATSGELCAVLWEDGTNIERQKTYLRQYYSSIRKALLVIGMEGAVRHARDAYSVNPEMLDCDYYRFLAMEPAALNSYHAEFMSQYSWAEMMIPDL